MNDQISDRIERPKPPKPPNPPKPPRKKGRPKGRKDSKPRRKARWKTKIVKVVKEVPGRGQRRPNPGKPAHVPTALTRHIVEELVVQNCWRQENIARAIRVDPKTLRKYYREELETAKARQAAELRYCGRLKATGGPPDPETGEPNWREADGPMLRFYLERDCGMVPPALQLQHSGALGVFDPSKLTEDELAQLRPIIAKVAGESFGGEGSPPFARSGDSEESSEEGEGEL